MIGRTVKTWSDRKSAARKSWDAAAGSRRGRDGGKVIGDRTQHDGRHEGKCADQEHGPYEHQAEGEVVGQERARGGGARFFGARNPAIAIGSTSAGNRPSRRTTPVAMFQAGLLSDKPSNPDPLLAAAEVNS